MLAACANQINTVVQLDNFMALRTVFCRHGACFLKLYVGLSD